jgi:hypothetical protein
MNDEADILSVSFSDGCLRAKKPEIGNDYIFVFPKKHVSLRDSALTAIELTPGASYQRIAHTAVSDTLFFLDVTSQSGRYVKRYPVIASYFPSVFDFESWATPTVGYLYENPKEGSLQWFSSNNGAAIAWNNPARLAADYPIRRAVRALSGASAVELRTMKGPGHIFGTIDVPCMSGSLYLGGFNPLTGLTNPLHSTRFGVPFSDGRPVKLTGYYIYKEGEGDYINPDGSTTANRRDTCAIYAVLFKTDSDTQYLYGDDIATSPNIIARAELSPDDVRISPDFTRFEIAFNYAPYTVPFSFAELYNDEYKITIVFASSHKGDTYEGRIGNTLIIDRLELEYEDENGH